MTDDGARHALETGAGWYRRAGQGAGYFLLIVTAGTVIGLALIALRVVVLPLAFAVVFASALVIPNAWLRRRGLPPAVAGLLLLVLLAAGIGLATVLVSRSLVAEWDQIAARLADGIHQVVTEVQAGLGMGGDRSAVAREDVEKVVASVVDFLATGLFRVVPAVLEIGSTVLLTAFVLFFVLKDGDRIWPWLTSQLPRREVLLDRIGRRVWNVIGGYMRGISLIAAVDAVAIGLGLWLLGVPYAGAVGMLTFLLAYIPMVGAFISGGLGVFLAVAEAGLSAGVAALLIVLVVQQVDSNVLQPLILGRAVRLHPLVVAFGMVVGATFAGIVGMFLAVPVTAAATVVVAELRRAGVFGGSGDELGRTRTITRWGG